LLYFLAIALILSGCASRNPDPPYYGWYLKGVRVPDTSWRGHNGPFLAEMILTDNPQGLYKFWDIVSADLPAPHLDEASPGTQLEAVVVLGRCEPDTHGNCNVWGTASVKTTEGTVVIDQQPISLV